MMWRRGRRQGGIILIITLLMCCLLLKSKAIKNETGPGLPNIYICQAEDETFIGQYLPGDEIDGVATFENEEGKAIWRHGGFWYMGDLSVGWPPETMYRCIEGCKYQEELPPISGFTSRTREIPAAPKLQFEPCDNDRPIKQEL